jgi:Ca-activated chloride channel family protein
MKEAAGLVVDRLGSGDTLAVVVFDDTADVIYPCAPVLDRTAIRTWIDAIQERGGTHMSSGMSAGLRELQRGQAPDRVSRMLLLTDGQTWEDVEACHSLADQCRQAGISLNALGLGVGDESNWDPRLLEELAVRSGGEWTVVDHPDKVTAVFASTLQAVQGVSLSNVALTLRMVEGVTPRAVWRVTPLISRLGQSAVGGRDVQVFLGDIQSGGGQAILVDLLLPPRKAGSYRLLQADIVYDLPASGLARQRAALDIVVPFTQDPALAGQTQGRVMNIIERVVAHKLQTQALDEAAAGDIPRATMRLRAAATRLLELGEDQMAEQANQQAEHLEQSGQIDTADMQRMRYATRRLTETELAQAAESTPPAFEEPIPPAPEETASDQETLPAEEVSTPEDAARVEGETTEP